MRAWCSTRSITSDGILYPMRIKDMTRFGFIDALFPETADVPVE